MSQSLEELARRVRRWIAVEELLFETLGRWARELPEPEVKRLCATWCHRHAWHAELWRARLPAVDGLDGDTDDVAHWIAPLRDALAGVGTTADAIAVMTGPVLQALEAAVAEHRDAVDPRLDGPSARVLNLVGADLDREHRDFAQGGNSATSAVAAFPH